MRERERERNKGGKLICQHNKPGSGRGKCIAGKKGALNECQCVDGWTGADCSSAIKTKVVCKAKCVHGKCVDGRCSCEGGWYGESCTEKKAPTCPNDCKGSAAQRGTSLLPRGVCSAEGKCVCSPGLGGSDCSVTCQNRCSGQGECVQSVDVAAAAAGRKELGSKKEDTSGYACRCNAG